MKQAKLEQLAAEFGDYRDNYRDNQRCYSKHIISAANNLLHISTRDIFL